MHVLVILRMEKSRVGDTEYLASLVDGGIHQKASTAGVMWTLACQL